jgi:hypothetical protein
MSKEYPEIPEDILKKYEFELFGFRCEKCAAFYSEKMLIKLKDGSALAAILCEECAHLLKQMNPENIHV